MQRLSRGTIIETVLWLCFALFAYYFSFEFDRDFETYKFNATGWPRTVILLIVIAALLNIFMLWRKGEDKGDRDMLSSLSREDLEKAKAELEAKAGGATLKTEEEDIRGTKNWIRVLSILFLPVAYAWFLEPVGFYALTPFFILFFLILAGERRWQALASVTVGIYVTLVFVFGKLLYINLPVGVQEPFYSFSNWLLVWIR